MNSKRPAVLPMFQVQPYLYQPLRKDVEESNRRDMEKWLLKNANVAPGIFTSDIQGKTHVCTCANCPSTYSSNYDFCCLSLWSEETNLTAAGKSMKAYLEEHFLVEGEKPVRCFTELDKFKNRFLNKEVADGMTVGGHLKENERDRRMAFHYQEITFNDERRFQLHRLMAYRFLPDIGRRHRMEFPKCFIDAVRCLCPNPKKVFPEFIPVRPEDYSHEATEYV